MTVRFWRNGGRPAAMALLMLPLLANTAAGADRATGFSLPPIAERREVGPADPAPVGAKLLLDRDYFPALLDGIGRARREITLSTYLFRTIEGGQGYPEAVLKSLVAAAGRGVRVEVVLERSGETDDLNRDNADTARRLTQGGIRVCMDAEERVTHTKLVVIDRRYLLIGSHNLTQSALKFNHEASVWIDSASLAEQLLAYVGSLCSSGWK